MRRLILPLSFQVRSYGGPMYDTAGEEKAPKFRHGIAVHQSSDDDPAKSKHIDAVWKRIRAGN